MTGRRLNVLQVLPALDSGGVERGVFEVADALVQAGHRSLVVSGGGRMVESLTRGGSEHFTRAIGRKSPTVLRHVAWMRRFLLEQQVDLIDLHSRMPGWVTWLAWKSLPETRRPRLLSSLHGLHSVGTYSSVMCRGELVLVVSETVRAYVLRNYPFVSEARIRLVPRGIDAADYPRGFQPSDSWREDFYDEFPQLKGRAVVCLPGRLTRLKGHADFLQAIKALKQQGLPVHGLIVGGSHPKKLRYAAELRENVAAMGLGEDVTFTGRRSDLREIYAVSQAVVSVSQTPESFGRTVAEALSIGTPVAGYAHGGVAEILAAQFPEGAVVNGDVEDLTNVLGRMLSNPQQAAIGPNPFSLQRMLQGTLDVYHELCPALSAEGLRPAA